MKRTGASNAKSCCDVVQVIVGDGGKAVRGCLGYENSVWGDGRGGLGTDRVESIVEYSSILGPTLANLF